MRAIFFNASPPSSPMTSPPRHTFSATLMDENIDNAHLLISKWDFDSSNSSVAAVPPIFSGDRCESNQYLSSIKALQSTMQYYITEDPASESLVKAQHLMTMAMKRLEMEFSQIVKSHNNYLDAESDFEMERVSVVAMEDLKAIADCMISSGYGKECVKIYKIIRKSAVDEALHHLRVDRFNFSQIQKMDWEVLESKIKIWLYAVKVAVKTVFHGERILSDYVFASSDSIRESCFAEITADGAIDVFGFPESVAKSKKTPEKMFRTLDLYEAINDLWNEIEVIFSFESTSAVRSLAGASLIKLGEAVRTMLTDFESAISRDNSKTPLPGGGVHPLCRYVMNYIAFLADYSGVLTVIVADQPLTAQSRLPESYSGSSTISARLAWLVLVLLCKLDGKAELYKEVSLSYLFLANNLRYVVSKVGKSRLKLLIGGEEWIGNHEDKVKQYWSNYERVGWSEVYGALPADLAAVKTADQAAERFKRFNYCFEEAYKKQRAWVVPDSKLRDEIKISVAKKIVPGYRELYEKFRVVVKSEIVRFAPDDIANYLSDLFFGTTDGPGSVSSVSHGGKSR